MNVNDSRIYLCKADHSLLGTITGIKTETCSLIKNATDLWELSFEINKYIEKNGQLAQSDYYDSIDEMMRLYFDSDDIQAFFMIDSEPIISGDSHQEVKKVTAHSVECELCNMFLQNLKINCGTPDSQEYLVTDENNSNSNIYNGIPIEYVSLVNYKNPQLSLLHLVLQNTGWSVEKNLSNDICKLKGSFETSESVYSFLMKTVSSAFSIIFKFDRKNRKVGFIRASDFGKDTGIFVSMRNLMNNFEVTSSSSDAIMTKIIPTGANNLGIEQVNFGKDYILNLDYFMGTLNEYGNHKFVSKDLYDKYNLWKNYRDVEKVTYENNKYTRRELYSELTKLYNQSVAKISELKNRVPNDGCMIDYTKFSLEELKQSLIAYENALSALITCYKNEIIEKYDLPKDTMITINSDFTLTFNPELEVPISPTPLPQSVYWYDYYAYKEKIIPQILETLKMYCETDENGNLVVDENGKYIELEHGNPKYYTETNIIRNIESYLYEWSLYGLDELEAKRKAWSEAANLLFNKCFIVSGTIESPIYRVPDDNGWDSLAENEKLEFTTKIAFFNQLNQYLDYMSLDNERKNSLTNTKGKGIIRQCIDAIEERKRDINKETEKQTNYNNLRINIANSVTFENFTVDNNPLFSEKDIRIIQSMIRTKYYSNDYILTTNLDDIVSIVDRQEELYQSALEELYKISQPQYSFKTELDNLYALNEFKEYQKTFDIGNYIRVGLEIHEELYDNKFVKLRLISITYNPLEINEQLSIEFSTITKSLNGIDDLDFLLNNMASTNGGVSSSSSSAHNSTYGNNDANVQISNNMLNALLNTEMFGTAISDVILDSIQANKGNFNTLLSHSGIFDSLETGKIKVSGDCLVDHIKSSNYVDGKFGSMLNLIDGSFSFASGALTYDPKQGLIIKGVASSNTVDILSTNLSNLSTAVNTMSNGLTDGTTNINGGCISTGSIKSNNWNGSVSNLIGNSQGSIICLNDGKFNLGGGKLKWDGENLQINGNGKFTGEIQGTSGTFYGNITATTLTANQSGIIAGWTFDENGFYKENAEIGKENSMFLGETGISVGDYFIVDRNRFIFKDKCYANTNIVKSIDFQSCNPDSSNIPRITENIGIYDNDCIIVCFNCEYSIQTPTSLDGVITINGEEKSENSSAIYADEIMTYLDLNMLVRKFRDEGDFDKYEFYHRILVIADEYSSQYIAIFKLKYCIYFEDSSWFEITKFELINSEELVNVSLIYNNHRNDYPVNQFNISKTGMCIDSYSKKISIDNIEITGRKILAKDNYSIQFGNSLLNTIIDDNGIKFYNSSKELNSFFNSYGIQCSNIYGTKVSGKALYANLNGLIGLSSSSKRFKNSISANLTEISDPHGLYDIDIVQYKYNDDYFSSPNDEGIGKYFIGFIAEEVAEKFKDGATFDKNGIPDGWDIRYMFPAALKLIQEQYHDIQELKKNAQGKNREIKNLQKEIEAMKQQFQEIKPCNINH